MSLVSLAIPANKFPCEGPKTVPLTLDFSAAETKLVDLFQLTYSGAISFVVTLFVDNSENDSRLIIVSETSGQRIIVPPNGNGYVQIMAQNPARLQVTLEATPVAPFRVKIHANNFPTQSGFERVPFVPIAPFPDSLFNNGEMGMIYDMSRLDTLFEDSAMTIPASVNGPVGAHMDISPNAIHRIQASAANRPTLRYDAVNNIYYLDCTGDDKFLYTQSNVDFSNTAKISYCWGINKIQISGGIVFETGPDVSSVLGSFAFYVNQFPDACLGRSITPGSTFTYRFGNTPTARSVFTALMDMDQPAAANKVVRRINGVIDGALSPGVGEGNFSSHVIYFLNNVFTTIPWRGPDYGGIIVGRALTDSEISQIETWVGLRSGVTL